MADKFTASVHSIDSMETNISNVGRLNGYIGFLIILTSSLLSSEVFERPQVPYAVALIAPGIVIGPSCLDLIELTPSTVFLGSEGNPIKGIESRNLL